MKIITEQRKYTTHAQTDFVDITDDIREVVAQSGVTSGSVTVFAAHTTMGVAINHNEPMLLQDFARMLYRIAPVNEQYAHDLFELRQGAVSDGRSNGHSHAKALIVGTSETVPIVKGILALSALQSIFIVDFDGPRKRDVMVQVIGV